MALIIKIVNPHITLISISIHGCVLFPGRFEVTWTNFSLLYRTRLSLESIHSLNDWLRVLTWLFSPCIFTNAIMCWLVYIRIITNKDFKVLLLAGHKFNNKINLFTALAFLAVYSPSRKLWKVYERIRVNEIKKKVSKMFYKVSNICKLLIEKGRDFS